MDFLKTFRNWRTDILSRRKVIAQRNTTKNSAVTELEMLETRVLLSATSESTGLGAFMPDFDLTPGGSVIKVKGISEEAVEKGGNVVNFAQMEPVANPLAMSFNLSSKPDANHTLYLDFDGQTVSGTGWQNGGTFTINPYSVDADPAFNQQELDNIRAIWERVAEDFAPFDINVTTQEPALEDLQNSGSGDNRWGGRVIVGGSWDDVLTSAAGGVAFLNSFNSSGDVPSFAFSETQGPNNLVVLTETISHEAGHMLGLVHDGDQSNEYYSGHATPAGNWGAIMGAAFSGYITQWSQGDYPGANETEDDLSIITGQNGFGYRTDDYGSTFNAPSQLLFSSQDPSQISTDGIIEQNTDLDIFEFFTNGGQVSINIDPFLPQPNLKVGAILYDANFNQIAVSNDSTRVDAEFNINLPAGTYYLSVDGVGLNEGNLAAGFSDYGSLGQYFITGTIPRSGTIEIVEETFNVDENSNNGTNVGQVNFTGTNAVLSVVYMIDQDGRDVSGLLNVDTVTGLITVADQSMLNFELISTVQIGLSLSTTDTIPITTTGVVTVDINDINDLLSAEDPQNFAVEDDASTGTVVGTLIVQDDDVNQVLTYDIRTGNEEGIFTIDPNTGVITVADQTALTNSTENDYSLTIRVTDNAPVPSSILVNAIITKTNTNDQPIFNGGFFFIGENSPSGAEVGTLFAADPNSGQTLSFTIVGGNDLNAFQIDSNTGVITVFDNEQLDFEDPARNRFVLQVQVSDDGTPSLSNVQDVIIVVGDEVENTPFDFERVEPFGSLVFKGIAPVQTINGASTATTNFINYSLFMQQGGSIVGSVAPVSPTATLTVKVIALDIPDPNNNGEPTEVFNLDGAPGQAVDIGHFQFSQDTNVIVKVESNEATDVSAEILLNTGLEGSIDATTLAASSNSLNDYALTFFGQDRYVYTGTLDRLSVNQTEVDEVMFTVDDISTTFDVVLARIDGSTEFDDITFEIRDPSNSVVARGTRSTSTSNADISLLNFNPTVTGDYRILIFSETDSTATPLPMKYTLSVFEGKFDIEPNINGSGNPREVVDGDFIWGYVADSTTTVDNTAYSISEGAAATSTSQAVQKEAENHDEKHVERPVSQFTHAVPDTTITETETNDTLATANPIPLGFTGTEFDAIEVIGTINPPVQRSILGVEDDGSITLANETNLVYGEIVTADGIIGNGPFSNTSGDFDFYAVRGLTTGQLLSISANTPFSTLDPTVAVYDSTGALVGFNDDGGVGLDSFLNFSAPADGDYFISVQGFGSGTILDPFDSSSGIQPGSIGSYELELSLGGDVDVYSFELDAGDILNTGFDGVASFVEILDSNGNVMQGSGQNASFIYPVASPLRNAFGISASAVAPTAGTYYVRVSGSTGGTYNGNVEVYRPILESEDIFTSQTLFIDFDGATIDMSVFGGTGTATLSGLSTFLGNWGLTATDEDAVIDAILASIEESLRTDLGLFGTNGEFDTTNNFGDFDINILNSRDHADPFGNPNVSRVIIGGTIAEFGISTIGLAQSIDVGNFDTAESSVVLLDLLSEVASNPNSLNQYAIAATSSIIDLIGVGVGNIAAHEAGHFFGAWHTDQFNATPGLMDQGGNLDNTVGVGIDRVFGTADDIDVDFNTDAYVANEGFTGQQDSLNTLAHGLSTGTTYVDLTGPLVTSVTPPGGVTNDLTIDRMTIVFNEQLAAATAGDLANYTLRSAGADGVLFTADDSIELLNLSGINGGGFDGNQTVTLGIPNGPLAEGRYLLTVGSGVTDFLGNELGSTISSPNGVDFVHEFVVSQAAEGQLDQYVITLQEGELIELTADAIWNNPNGTPVNDLTPELVLLSPQGLTVATSTANSGSTLTTTLQYVAPEAGEYTIGIRSRGGEGEYAIQVTSSLNLPPVISDQTFLVNENSPQGFPVDTIAATDPEFNNLTFSVTGGSGVGVFAVDPGTGEITVINSAALNFEATPSFTLEVDVTDDGVPNLTSSATITINLVNVNEAPVIQPTYAFSIPENSANTTPVGTVAGSDVDDPDTISYSITGGPDASVFAVDSVTGEITVANSAALDFETQDTFNFTITVTDSGSLTDTTDVTVTLTNVNENVTINDQVFSVDENVAAGTVVGTLLASDPDAGTVITFSITGGADPNVFAVDPQTGEITVVDASAINFEINPQFSFIVTVTDDGVPASTDTALITINVNDLVDGLAAPFLEPFDDMAVPPQFIFNTSGNGSFTYVDRPDVAGTDDLAMMLGATEVSATPILNEMIIEIQPPANPNDELFLDFDNRERLEEDHPMPATFTGSNNSDGVAISVDGVNWFRLISLTELNSTETFQHQTFNLTETLNQLSLTPTSFILVKFQQFDDFSGNSDGIYFDNIQLSLAKETNNAPTITNATFNIDENVANGTVVGTPVASDPDVADTITYSIVSGNESGTFAIDSETGEITVADNTLLDFETNPTFTLVVEVVDSDVVPLATQATITVQLNDISEAQSIFFADFEDDDLGLFTITSTSSGRVQQTTDNGPSEGLSHLTMDTDTSSINGPFSLNEVQFSFDASSLQDIILSFDVKEFNDEDHFLPLDFVGSANGDGVAISTDGTNWKRLYSFTQPFTDNTYQTVTLDLDDFAANNSLTLDGTVFIKFVQYDNSFVAFDGIALDNIQVTGVQTASISSFGTLAFFPDSFEQDDVDNSSDETLFTAGSEEESATSGSTSPLALVSGSSTGSSETSKDYEAFGNEELQSLLFSV